MNVAAKTAVLLADPAEGVVLKVEPDRDKFLDLHPDVAGEMHLQHLSQANGALDPPCRQSGQSKTHRVADAVATSVGGRAGAGERQQVALETVVIGMIELRDRARVRPRAVKELDETCGENICKFDKSLVQPVRNMASMAQRSIH